MQVMVIAAALLGVALTAGAALQAGGPTLAAAVGLGAAGGLGLYHASFGFTGAWRRLQRERRGSGVRAQLLMVGLVVAAAYPLIASGIIGRGWVFPLSAASALGAFMFGVGMQLGGGCGSGTLFTAGGGSTRMMVTLAAFIAGSVVYVGTDHLSKPAIDAAWTGLTGAPSSSLGAISLLREFGAPGAMTLSLAALGAIWLWTVWLERRAHGALEAERRSAGFWRGPWSRQSAAALLAAVVIGCFFLLDRPWGVTAAFPLWGVKIADAAGAPAADWVGWSDQAVARSVFADATSVMNFGVMLGALAAAGAAGAFAPQARLSLRDGATAVIGGILMGYGARLAFGCNIGGLVGGIASASAHGWWWLAFGALGSVLGVWLRAWLGMDPPAPRSTGLAGATRG